MPRRKDDHAQASSGTAAGTPQLSEDLADLVKKKIREFEQNAAEENEKTQRAHKGKARAVAKTKLKEVKQLLNSSDVSDAEKVKRLWERFRAEHQQAEEAMEDSLARQREIGETETDRDANQAELNRVLAVKGKLESLCKQLQRQTNALVEERRRMEAMERQRRQELADEFSNTIGDVKKTMEQQAQERTRLARENEELRSRFKQFFEQYDTREKERLEQQRARELELQVFELRLAEQAQLYRQEAAKEAEAARENEELNNTEQVLRGQLQTYSSKFNHFQDALSKSDKVLGQYKRQRNKMQRRVEVLEKENAELRIRSEKRTSTVGKEKDSLLKEKEVLQEKCKQLQVERQQLLEEVQKLNGHKPGE